MASREDSSNTNEKVTLKSKDGKEFEVDPAVAMKSEIIKNLLEDCSFIGTVPLSKVDGATLSKVVEYCKKHAEGGDSNLGEWDDKFINVDLCTLYNLIQAANYLGIQDLLDLACKCVADLMKGKTPKQLREIFHIKNDFTPEEETAIKKVDGWAWSEI